MREFARAVPSERRDQPPHTHLTLGHFAPYLYTVPTVGHAIRQAGTATAGDGAFPSIGTGASWPSWLGPTVAVRSGSTTPERPPRRPGMTMAVAIPWDVQLGSSTAPMNHTDPKLTRTDAAWLDAHWMPFTGNREFKAHPRILVAAEGAYYTDSNGKKVLDGLSGLWCCGLGHGRREIVEAVSRQAATLDYAPGFQYGHPQSFALANKIKELTPDGLDYVFFTGSGSEAADTSLKMARAYWRAKGQGTKTRLIGREKGYHGVNFGGISVGGIGGNRKTFGQAVEADHLPHTMLPAYAFTKGMPQDGGVEL